MHPDDTHGLASSQSRVIISEESPHYELAGVTLRPGPFELIEAQIHLMKKAADEAQAARYAYQLEGVLLTLIRMEEISHAQAQDLRTFIHAQLPAILAAMIKII
ncbi:hypothetical protein [Pseudomonas gingeri]|uniref:Uncharacterized protein n=1 Tax=Pseudomonas gingeri TaxID=117681 RepID=A0A7Y7WFJ2_9PSED|nr:hypothetical protein [Pseudomonas gingeri]NWB48276.1 hypothetical protein [Pseudomonas gingeri]